MLCSDFGPVNLLHSLTIRQTESFLPSTIRFYTMFVLSSYVIMMIALLFMFYFSDVQGVKVDKTEGLSANKEANTQAIPSQHKKAPRRITDPIKRIQKYKVCGKTMCV